MTLLRITIVATSLSVFAWAQAAPNGGAQQPSAQPGQSQAPGAAAPQTAASAAPSPKTNVSGCMQESWGRYLVKDTATNTIYDVRQGGTNLSQYANHVVQVSGVTDPKAASGSTVTLYAQQLQNSGQACGTAPAVAGAPATGAGAATPTPNQPTGTQPSGGVAANPNAQPPVNAQPGTSSQPGATPQQQQSPGMTTTPQAATPQSAPTPQPNSTPPSSQSPNSASMADPQASGEMENKGTPAAGTPSQAMGSQAGEASAEQQATTQAATGGQTFSGCLRGDDNNLELKSNGKTYHLQGDTTSLRGMKDHQMQITGEELNGKAVEVKSARALGDSCNGK